MSRMIDRDVEHLKLLSIFHYVVGGLMVLFGFVPLLYVLIGVMFINMPDSAFTPTRPNVVPVPPTIVVEPELEPGVEDPDFDIVVEPGDSPDPSPPPPTPMPGPTTTPGPGGGPPPGMQRNIGFFFIGFGIVGSLLVEAMAFLMIFAGYKMARASNWTLCLVVAALELLGFPFVTILGVFTLIVLCRKSVKDLFSGRRFEGDGDAYPPPLPR